MTEITQEAYDALVRSVDALKRENEKLHADIKLMEKNCRECVRKREEIDLAVKSAYRDALKIVTRRKK